MTSKNSQIARRDDDTPEVIQTQHGGVVAQGVPDAMTQVLQTRTAQEVQAAMAVAQRFPRDEEACVARILKACQRQTLAEVAVYSYPRGDTTVSGPSIRLAEEIARNWKHLNFGFIVIEQKKGMSVIEAYAWDMETNVRRPVIFNVPHVRYLKNNRSYALTDPRDIYETEANQAQRRVRSCILALIPGDVVDAAVRACGETLKNAQKNSKVPIKERIEKMIGAFEEYDVTKEQIEKYLGHRADVTNEHELIKLQRVYVSIKDNMADPKSIFSPPPEGEGGGEEKSRTEQVKERLGVKKKEDTDPPKDQEARASAQDVDEVNTLLEATGNTSDAKRSAAIFGALGGDPNGAVKKVSELTASEARNVIAFLSTQGGGKS